MQLDLSGMSNLVSPVRVGQLLQEYLPSRRNRGPAEKPEDFLGAVAAEHYRLGAGAVRKLRVWRIMRLSVLILIAPVAPLALTSYSWLSAVLAGLVAVVEGALALWNLTDMGRLEMEVANQLEIELLRYSGHLSPYDSSSDDERLILFISAIAELKRRLSTGYLRTLDSSIMAATAQTKATSGKAGPDGDATPREPSPPPSAG